VVGLGGFREIARGKRLLGQGRSEKKGSGLVGVGFWEEFALRGFVVERYILWKGTEQDGEVFVQVVESRWSDIWSA